MLNPETVVLVNFIGHNSHSELPMSKISKFEEKLEECSRIKKRSLQKSIELAKTLIMREKNSDKNMLPKLISRSSSKNVKNNF